MSNRRALFAGVVAPVLVACALCAPGGRAWADDQSGRIEALERQLQTSLRLIETLSARVAELERAAQPLPAKPGPDATAARPDPATEQARRRDDADRVPEGPARRDPHPGVPLRGFADVGAVWSAGADPAKLHGFTLGTLDLYLTPQFGDRVKSLVEIALEFEEDGTRAVELERLQLGYTASDSLTLWMGRFHTPFGLWNTSFHHGAFLQTSIFRPRFVDFEDKGGILPVHTVGVWATGKTRLGGGDLTYDGYLGNGPSIRQRRLDPNAFTGDGTDTMVGFNLGWQPAAPRRGLTLGIHGFGSNVDAYTTSATRSGRTRLRASGAYLAYDADAWEAIGEFYRFDNVDRTTGARHASNAWFVQVGRRFGSLTPFVRFERASLDSADHYFRSLQTGRSYRRSAVGARHALDASAALKFEWSSTSEAAMSQLDASGMPVPFDGRNYRRAAVQYSIAF